MVAARYPNDRIGLGGGAGNTGEGGDNGTGICGGDEDHGDSGDAGGEDIAKKNNAGEVWCSCNHRLKGSSRSAEGAVAGKATTTG
ncbi:hypothetical protein Tco_0013828 [Tanacetum coccineum]